MDALKQLLTNHTDFKDLNPDNINYLCGSARKATFPAHSFIFKTGEPAEEFYIIKSGKVALEVYSPPKGPLTILTLKSNDILGWSWLYPPYAWHFEARAANDTTVYAFDAIKIRQECRKDFEFGYCFTNCFGKVMMRRLGATRLQLLDVFGTDTGFPNYNN
jgi:CRP-like cAMP-binding protein